MPQIGIRELATHTSKIMRQVRDECIRYVITYRGRPAGLLLPLEAADPADQLLPQSSVADPWDELVELGQEIGRDWQAAQRGAEILSDMRRWEQAMAKTFTIDAGVFINAFNPAEEDHAERRRLLAQMRRQARPLIVPTLVLPEVSAAIRRGRGDEQLARRFAAALSRLPQLMLVPLDNQLAWLTKPAM